MKMYENVFVAEKGEKAIVFNNLTGEKIYTSKNEIESVGGIEGLRGIDRLKKNGIKLTMPQINTARIECTYDCNLRCDYCIVYKNDIPVTKSVLSIETAKKIIERCNELRIRNFMFMGGEPLTNWTVVRYMIENLEGSKLLVTNGTLIDEEKCSVFIKCNVQVAISLDGYYETDNKYRKDVNGELIYKKVIQKCELLKKWGCKLTIFSVAHDDNLYHLSETIFKMIITLKPSRIGVNILHYTNENDMNFNVKKYTEEMLNLYYLVKNMDVYIEQIHTPLYYFNDKRLRLMHCKIAGEQITFLPSGEETLCTKLDTLNDREWDQKTLQEALPIFNEKCRNCEAIGICGGGCFWDAEKRFFGTIDKNKCYFNRKLFETFLWDSYPESINEEIFYD